MVMARIAAMLRAGTIRRVRQTLLATNLADGALVAWKVAEDKIDAAFDLHVSTRSVFRSRGLALDRHADSRLGLQALDHSEGAARILAGRTLRIARRQSRRRTFSDYAGERNFHAWRWARPPENYRAGKSR